MATETHKISVGDTLTPLACQLKQKDVNGALAAVNLTKLTVKFSMVDSLGAAVVTEATIGVTVTDATTGKVQYDFQAGDVDIAGTFYGWFLVYDGTEHDTFPADGRRLVIVISPRG